MASVQTQPSEGAAAEGKEGSLQTSAQGSELRHASHLLARVTFVTATPPPPGSPAPGPPSWLHLQPRGPEHREGLGSLLTMTLTGGVPRAIPILSLTCLP